MRDFQDETMFERKSGTELSPEQQRGISKAEAMLRYLHGDKKTGRKEVHFTVGAPHSGNADTEHAAFMKHLHIDDVSSPSDENYEVLEENVLRNSAGAMHRQILYLGADPAPAYDECPEGMVYVIYQAEPKAPAQVSPRATSWVLSSAGSAR